MTGSGEEPAATLVQLLRARGETVGTAESLTGGLLCAALVDVPGASQAVRGAVVAYAADVKVGVLGVPATVLAEHGTVSTATARAMAERARTVLAVDWAVATTGVAGPDPAEGRPPGTVHLAVAGRARVAERSLILDGDRADVRRDAVRAALALLRVELLAAGAAAPTSSDRS